MSSFQVSFWRVVTALALFASTVAPADAATAVTVDNSTAVASAIATALQTGEPFVATVSCSLLFTNACSSTYSVPAKQQLVIEYVSFICPTSDLTPSFGLFTIHSTGAGVAASNEVTLPQNAGGGFAQLGQPVKIYADPGSEIVVTAALRTGAFSSSPPPQIAIGGIPCNVTLNGRKIAE